MLYTIVVKTEEGQSLVEELNDFGFDECMISGDGKTHKFLIEQDGIYQFDRILEDYECEELDWSGHILAA